MKTELEIANEKILELESQVKKLSLNLPVSSSKIMVEGKDFKIEQSRMTVEHFVWNCPDCGNANRTLEFSVHDMKLFCSGCWRQFTYAWK